MPIAGNSAWFRLHLSDNSQLHCELHINVVSPDNTTRTMQHERAVKFVPAGLRAITIQLAQCYEDSTCVIALGWVPGHNFSRG